MIKTISTSELEDIYNNHMIYDFPEDELKPLNIIVESINQDKSIAIAYYENNEIKGYATLLKADRCLVLDYFAIFKKYRQMGYGSLFLKEIFEYFNNYDMIMIESEAKEDPIALKRLEFYKRCGCLDSGLKGYLYFVDYVLLYKELSRKYNENEIKEEIFKIYHLVYPDFENTKYLVFH